MIEVQDARRLAIDLKHVEIAIGIERIARVVARDHYGDARGVELVQGRDATPARRAAGDAVLQIHVAHRQRHDRDARFGYLRDDRGTLTIVGERERAAVAGDDAPFELVPPRGVGDLPERTSFW